MALDWKEMFNRYSWRVTREEGISFLYEDDWTAEEWDQIKALPNTAPMMGKPFFESFERK